MLAIVSLLVVVLASLIVARIATVLLTLTGLPREIARFQARSALTGVGFTTREAESVVGHPVRRRVVMTLMLIGSVGVVTVIATLLLSFVDAGGRETGTRMALLVVGLVGIFVLARSRAFEQALTRLVARAAARWTDLDTRDYVSLLRVAGDYAVMEVFVEPDDWVAEKTLGELALREEGIAVLGIQLPSGEWDGVPVGHTRVRPGDTIVLYGRGARLRELDSRPHGADGDDAHREAVEEQQRLARASAGATSA